MAKYLFLLHPDGVDLQAMADTDKQALFGRFVAWSESLKAKGQLVGVESLMDRGGQTVRKRKDAIVVDGPFAEMKEMVSGLFIVEAEDERAAAALASECPLVQIGGAVEVRAISPFPVRP